MENETVKEPILWEPKKVKTKSLIANPNNPKIETEFGKKRLEKLLDMFGLAGTIVANLDMTIIDGHTRVEDAIRKGIEEIWVSFPSRALDEEEYKLMNAMFDEARAGEMDRFMVENLFSEKVLVEWDLSKETGHEKEEKELFPIVPKYDEKHEAIIIICYTESEVAFVRDKLLMDENSSYKNKNHGQTFVTTGKQFIKVWQLK